MHGRWEGNPSTNIVIQNNTVIDTPYVPGLTSPAINVYAGGDYLGAVSPIQQNITITGNLVIGGMVGTPFLREQWLHCTAGLQQAQQAAGITPLAASPMAADSVSLLWGAGHAMTVCPPHDVLPEPRSLSPHPQLGAVAKASQACMLRS